MVALSRPGSRPPAPSLGRRFVFAILGAVVVGGLLGVLAGWLGWLPASSVPLPSDAAAVQIARLVGTPDPTERPNRVDALWGTALDQGPAVGMAAERYSTPGRVEVMLSEHPSVEKIRARLATAGWRVGSGDDLIDAVRGPLALRLANGYPAQETDDVYRAQPAAVRWAAPTGALLGIALGGLAGLRLARRRGRAVVAITVGLVLLLPAGIGALGGYVVPVAVHGPTGIVNPDLFAPYPGGWTWLDALGAVVVLGGVLGGVAAQLGRRRRTRRVVGPAA